MFSSAYSLVHGFLCRKQTCTVTVCDTPLDGPLSVDSTSSSRHRSIARYRLTIVLISADGRRVHSICDKARYWLRIAIFAYRMHLHLMPPFGGWRRNIAMTFGRKTRMVWPPDGENMSKISLFVFTECTNVTDGQTDTAWRHGPRLCIASRGKNDMILSSLVIVVNKSKLSL